MKKSCYNRGVTLIETMVYIALFSLIIGGAVVAAYQVFESNGRSETRAMLQEEGNFLIAKINSVLSGTQSISGAITSGQSCAQTNTLSITKWDSSVILIDASLGNVELKRGAASPIVLNNTNVSVGSSLRFTHCSAGASEPESLKTEFTLSAKSPDGKNISEDFATVQYLRK